MPASLGFSCLLVTPGGRQKTSPSLSVRPSRADQPAGAAVTLALELVEDRSVVPMRMRMPMMPPSVPGRSIPASLRGLRNHDCAHERGGGETHDGMTQHGMYLSRRFDVATGRIDTSSCRNERYPGRAAVRPLS